MKFWFGKEKADEDRVPASKVEVPQAVPAAVPEPPKPTAVVAAPEAKPVELAVERRGAEARVRLPRIGAWVCGYLDFK